MSTDSRALLDDSEWLVESTALLPTDEPTALSSVSFTLSPELQARADALALAGTNITSELTTFFSEAVDLDVDVIGDSIEVLGPDDWSGDLFRTVVGRFGELADLHIDGYELADVIGELRLPVFASQPKETLPLVEAWGSRAGAVLTAAATVAPIVGGHAGAVLLMVAPPLGAAVVIGTYSTMGIIAGISYLRRRHRENQARREAAEKARQEQQARDKAARKAQQEESHRKTMEKQQKLKALAKAHPRPSIRPGPSPKPTES